MFQTHEQRYYTPMIEYNNIQTTAWWSVESVIWQCQMPSCQTAIRPGSPPAEDMAEWILNMCGTGRWDQLWVLERKRGLTKHTYCFIDHICKSLVLCYPLESVPKAEAANCLWVSRDVWALHQRTILAGMISGISWHCSLHPNIPLTVPSPASIALRSLSSSTLCVAFATCDWPQSLAAEQFYNSNRLGFWSLW